MIPRYSREEMVSVWSPTNRFEIWLNIELQALEALADVGTIPKSLAEKAIQSALTQKADIINPDAIDEIEQVTKHDVIAFLTHIENIIGPNARFLHLGMTSSDVLDTALAIQFNEALNIIIDDVRLLIEALADKAHQHKYVTCIGRSHGIHAEPTTFGLKMASHYAEFSRNLTRLMSAQSEISTCAISGAVGTFANINPKVEEIVADKLNLRPEPISTQVIPRDRHAMVYAILGVVASSLERLATEIRHLQRTEVGEVAESFASGQKGSSAMPHKQNPILTENITGLARYIRSTVLPAMENICLWHERDISHSSVERITAPDATIALDFALNRMIGVIKNLKVNETRMVENLNRTNGLWASQQVMLTLVGKGMARQKAYELVQRNALLTYNDNLDFFAQLQSDDELMKHVSVHELKTMCSLTHHTKHVDLIFRRVF